MKALFNLGSVNLIGDYARDVKTSTNVLLFFPTSAKHDGRLLSTENIYW